MSGTHSKMLINIQCEEWLAKFQKGDYVDTPSIEHPYFVLARTIGIHTRETRAHLVPSGDVFLSWRFDR